MFSLRVNFKTKMLIEETAAIAGLSVSEILRRVDAKVRAGKICPAENRVDRVAVQQYNSDNVIIYTIPENYHNHLTEVVTADIPPMAGRIQKEFRKFVVAACLDTRAKSIRLYEKKKLYDQELERANRSADDLMLVAERRAVMC